MALTSDAIESTTDIFPDRLRLPINFDAAELQRDVEALQSSCWVDHFVPAHYSGDWSALPLRAPKGAVHPIQQISANPGVSEWEDTVLLQNSPALSAALARLPAALQSARLMRLGPGSRIHEHSDPALSAEDGIIRLHIPVMTNQQVDFRLNGKLAPMAAGETWYLRLTDPHSVYNGGLSARVHLVVDCELGPSLAALLAGATASL